MRRRVESMDSLDALLGFVVAFVPAGLVFLHSWINEKQHVERFNRLLKYHADMGEIVFSTLKDQEQEIQQLRREIERNG